MLDKAKFRLLKALTQSVAANRLRVRLDKTASALSDDVGWVNVWRRHVGGVVEGAVVCVVLIQSPFSGVLD